MILNPSFHKRLNSNSDQTIILMLVLLFATLPFAAIDFSPFSLGIHRLFLAGTSLYCVLRILKKSANRIKVNMQSLVVGFCFIHSFVLTLIYGSVFSLKETVILFSLYFIIIGLRNICTDSLAKGVIVVSAFYCFDTIYQVIQGVDLFGFAPRNGRIWGAFYYGSPTFGVLLSMIFFIPYFYIKDLVAKTLVYILFTTTLILANDRAPILQIIFSFIVFFPFNLWKKLLIAALLTFPILFITSLEPSSVNRIFALYHGFKLFLTGDFHGLETFTASYGMDAYMQIWLDVVNNWFRWDNAFMVLFGTGWGIVPEVLGQTSDITRPHSTHLELMISWGVFGYLLFFGWLFFVYRRNRENFIILGPCVLPFAFFSLTSANYLFLISVVYVLFRGSSRSQELKN